ncbi:MAG: glycosyltransferase family 39 protein [bacterium]|nr:glycosyltransferase family 39 protein [bacterium]
MIFKLEPKTWLLIILALAFLTRVAGLNYGFPLEVVGDEATSIFGALKMMEIKTFLPVLHLNEFKTLLYYPPYLSYLYLPFFAVLLGLKFLFLNVSLEEFKNLIAADPALLFLAARFLSVIFGVGTVYLVYRIGKNIFKAETPALLAAGFLSLSLLHVNFSHWARHWVFATFFFALVIYILSREDLSPPKKYLWAALAAGLGVGVNYQVGLSAFFILFWFLFYNCPPLRSHLKKGWVYAAAGLFLTLVALAFLLYPPGLVVKSDSTFLAGHSLGGLAGSYGFYLGKLFEAEPLLLFFFMIGMIYLFLKERRFFWTALAFIFLYVAVFYFLFFTVERYILMLYPIFALAAGYGLYALYSSTGLKLRPAVLGLGVLSFLFLLLVAIRFDLILLKNDTRFQALEWVRANLAPGSKIAVLASLTHLPTFPEDFSEQGKIDPVSLRKRDLAELGLPDKFLSLPRYHALNLYAVNSESFFRTITTYLRENGYEYALYSPEFAKLRRADPALETSGEAIKTFVGFEASDDDFTNGFGGGLGNIFSREANGPTIVIKKI